MEDHSGGKTYIVAVFEKRQVAVDEVFLDEHGEDLLLRDQVVHQFG